MNRESVGARPLVHGVPGPTEAHAGPEQEPEVKPQGHGNQRLRWRMRVKGNGQGPVTFTQITGRGGRTQVHLRPACWVSYGGVSEAAAHE